MNLSMEAYIQMEIIGMTKLLNCILMSWWMLLWESIMHKALIFMLIYIGRLLVVMKDLGYPKNATIFIGNIYSNSNTIFT